MKKRLRFGVDELVWPRQVEVSVDKIGLSYLIRLSLLLSDFRK